MSCQQIWNIEQEKDRIKEKVGDRPAKLNEKKGDRDLERETCDVHVVVVQINGKEMYKEVCCTCKVAFLLTRPIVVFHLSPALPSPLSITRFYILFEQYYRELGF